LKKKKKVKRGTLAEILAEGPLFRIQTGRTQKEADPKKIKKEL